MSCSCGSDCNCDPCAVPGSDCPECAPYVAVPGPQGPEGPIGPSGAAGSGGQDAFTLLSSSYTQPAVGATTPISVVNSDWFSVGSYLFIPIGGFYKVTAIGSSVTATIQNLGGSNNAAPASIIANASPVVASGKEGPALLSPLPIADGGTGQATATAAMGALSPLSTTGDILAFSGGANIRIAAPASGLIWTGNGAGVLPTYQVNAPAAANITGMVAIANGGTAANTAAGARTNLAVPGTAANNTFTGTQAFNGTSFAVTTGGNAALSMTLTLRTISDLTGGQSVDADGRLLYGQWTQQNKSYVVASGATYSWASGVETVVSTRSATGAQVVDLPTGTDGRIARFIDGAGNASVNNLTLTPAGGDTVLGGGSYVVNLDYGSIKLMYIDSTNDWVPCP